MPFFQLLYLSPANQAWHKGSQKGVARIWCDNGPTWLRPFCPAGLTVRLKLLLEPVPSDVALGQTDLSVLFCPFAPDTTSVVESAVVMSALSLTPLYRWYLQNSATFKINNITDQRKFKRSVPVSWKYCLYIITLRYCLELSKLKTLSCMKSHSAHPPQLQIPEILARV